MIVYILVSLLFALEIISRVCYFFARKTFAFRLKHWVSHVVCMHMLHVSVEAAQVFLLKFVHVDALQALLD